MLQTSSLGVIEEQLTRFVAAVKSAAAANGLTTYTHNGSTYGIADYVANSEIGVDMKLAKIAVMTAKRLGGSDFDVRLAELSAVEATDDNALMAARSSIEDNLEVLSPAFENATVKQPAASKFSLPKIALAAIVGLVVGAGAYVGVKVWKRRHHSY